MPLEKTRLKGEMAVELNTNIAFSKLWLDFFIPNKKIIYSSKLIINFPT